MEIIDLSPNPDLKLLIAEKTCQEKGVKRHKEEQELSLKLLKTEFPKVEQIAHQPNGKPYLDTYPDIKLSISHSDKYIALLLSKSYNYLGIDIEDIGEQVERVQRKFVDNNEEELLVSSNNKSLALHLLWSAKESLYKALNPQEPYLQAFKLKKICLKPELKAELTLTYKEDDFIVNAFYSSDYVLSFFSE